MNQGQHRISIVKPDDPLVSVSNLGEKISVLRFAADSTEDAYKLLAEVLKPLAAGKLSGMQKPYADRIHSLVGQDFRQSRKDKLVTIDSDVIIKSGDKRRIEFVNDDITSNVSSTAKNPNLDPNDRMLGSAIRAMRKYDEMLLIDNRPISVPG